MTHAARRSLLRPVLVTAALVPCLTVVPNVLRGQVQPQGAAAAPAGTLTFTTSTAAAGIEARGAMADFFGWAWTRGAEHAARALALDSSFALARAMVGYYAGGPAGRAMIQQGAADAAAKGSAGEAVVALGLRELSAGRTQAAARLFDAAVALMPNDPEVALWRATALTDTARRAALRAVAAKYPDHVGARIMLAFYLAPWGFTIDSVALANGDEALRVAGEAVRLAPGSAGAHTAVGHVLHALGRDAEAMQHLTAATTMSPRQWYTYLLISDIDARDQKYDAQRAALDSAIALEPDLGRRAVDRRVKAAIRFGDGDAAGAMSELELLANELDAAGERTELANTHLWIALLSAGAHDSSAAAEHIAAAKRYGVAPGTLADNEVITYSLSGNASEARRALGDYVQAVNAFRNPTPAQVALGQANIHRMTGLTLLAERKPQEAIAELRQGGKNPYVTVGMIEAYRMMKQTKQADATRKDFFARREYTGGSTALQIIRYRSRGSK